MEATEKGKESEGQRHGDSGDGNSGRSASARNWAGTEEAGDACPSTWHDGLGTRRSQMHVIRDLFRT